MYFVFTHHCLPLQRFTNLYGDISGTGRSLQLSISKEIDLFIYNYNILTLVPLKTVLVVDPATASVLTETPQNCIAIFCLPHRGRKCL